jgi:hypothetical protein
MSVRLEAQRVTVDCLRALDEGGQIEEGGHMSPSDVAGVFSRYFIVGFFLPGFFTTVGLSQALSGGFLPQFYEELGGGSQIAVAGGIGLLVGLLLLGLNWQVFRLFEGYPIAEGQRSNPGIAFLHDLFIRRQKNAFDKLMTIRDGDNPAPDKANAAWKLDQEFPPSRDRLLPTRFGNAVLAFETHAMTRWGLDSVVVWPRIDAGLSDREAELQANARSEAAFFVNGSLLAFIAGLILLTDEAVNSPLHRWALIAFASPFLLSLLFARWSAGAATRWGSAVRAAIDMHRFDLYEGLGVRRPRNFSDERETVAPHVNEALVYGFPIPDEDFSTDPPKAKEKVE